ncbi:hypothetical protein EVAR_35715_1 [Eumeta japonica]|uniref:Uncharacterized protein n=1 Tax=Eumeta variegata TaxID=151549 RepID=A0A4C1VEI8_EUMVA|nr:hypothetical protein EVAR_35715_1 [Eumeta japonica]
MLYKTGECDSQPEGSVRTSLCMYIFHPPRADGFCLLLMAIMPKVLLFFFLFFTFSLKNCSPLRGLHHDHAPAADAADERSLADVGVLLQEESDLVLGMSVPRAYCAAGVLGGALVVAGGDETNSVELYDLATGQWRAGPPLPDDRGYAGAAVL